MKSLPFTPFETYLYEDDVPAHPCWQIARMRWKGAFARAALEKAWAETTARHPLWTASVRRGFRGRLHWVLRPRFTPPVHWTVRVPGREWPDWQPLDPEEGTSVRLYMVEGNGLTDAVLCLHHAVSDGLSLQDVMTDVFSRYAGELGEPAKVRSDPTFEALRARGHFGTTLWERCWLPVLQVAGIIAESGLLRRTVAPLLPHVPAHDAGPRPENWPTLACRTWSPLETAAIRSAAKREKVSLAELCTRDLQAAIGAWRQANGIGSPEDWIRLAMPLSLRRHAHGSWPAANIFSVTIIDRQAKQLANRERLLRRAHEDLALIEEWKFGYAFWMLLRLREWWPGGIRAYARRRVVRSTFVMSFVGKMFSRMPIRYEGQHAAVPGAVLVDVTAVAPTRPGTCACMDVALLFGSLAAYLNYDPRVLTRSQADAIVEEFAAQLARSAAGN
jgi:hypothetical protein